MSIWRIYMQPLGLKGDFKVIVQSPSHIWPFTTPWTAVHQASPSLTISWMPKFMSIALVMPPSHLILWCSLLLLPSIFPSITVFSNELTICIRWPKYWSFSFSISPSNENSGLISFKINWFDLLAVQFSLVQSLCRVRLFATPWIATRQASLSITNSQSSLRLTSIESVMPSSHLILRRPLLLLPPIPPSIRVFSNESTLQGTLKSLLQLHSSKASILQHSTFFTVQISQLYMSTGETIAWTIWIFVGKVISLSAKWHLCFSRQCLGLS